MDGTGNKCLEDCPVDCSQDKEEVGVPCSKNTKNNETAPGDTDNSTTWLSANVIYIAAGSSLLLIIILIIILILMFKCRRFKKNDDGSTDDVYETNLNVQHYTGAASETVDNDNSYSEWNVSCVSNKDASCEVYANYSTHQDFNEKEYEEESAHYEEFDNVCLAAKDGSARSTPAESTDHVYDKLNVKCLSGCEKDKTDHSPDIFQTLGVEPFLGKGKAYLNRSGKCLDSMDLNVYDNNAADDMHYNTLHDII